MQRKKFRIKKIESAACLFELTEAFGSDKPLKRIFQTVLGQGCRTILVEHDYDDPDYKNEYHSFYEELFKTYSDKTQRLHFFACDLKQDDIARLSQFKTKYLGFCSLRPFQSQKVVNAVIKPTEDANQPKRSFILCQKDFPVEIKVSDKNTQKLKIKGFPFIQQDGQLGCCAHASLATIDHFLASEYGREPYFVSKIVEAASQVPEIRREIPTTGLSALQISQVLKHMGYAPLIYQYGEGILSPFPPERVIYHYMESEIPIMLGILTESGGHALTIIGHSFEPDVWWALAQIAYYRRRPSGGPYHCSTTWIQNFIVQDDNFGPYLTVPKEFIWAKASEALLIVVPLPKNVNIQGEDAELYAYRMLSDEIILKWMLDAGKKEKNTKKWSAVFLEHLADEDLVLRTCLLDSKQFKKRYPAPHLKSFYQKVDMPDKVWVTEVSIPELFCQSRLRLGEVIIDSTSSMKFAHSFICIHLPGIIVNRNVNTEKWDYFPIQGDEPFTHIMR